MNEEEKRKLSMEYTHSPFVSPNLPFQKETTQYMRGVGERMMHPLEAAAKASEELMNMPADQLATLLMTKGVEAGSLGKLPETVWGRLYPIIASKFSNAGEVVTIPRLQNAFKLSDKDASTIYMRLVDEGYLIPKNEFESTGLHVVNPNVGRYEPPMPPPPVFIPSKYIKNEFDVSTQTPSRLNNPIHLKNGDKISGFNDINNKVVIGYTKNGEKFTMPVSAIKSEDIVFSKDSNKTAEYFKNKLQQSEEVINPFYKNPFPDTTK